MKKLLLCAVAVLGLATANAQETTVEENNSYLPQQGDWSIGFNANNAFSWLGNAFNGNTGNGAPMMSNNSQYGTTSFVGKIMDTDKTAKRYILGLNVGTATTKNDQKTSTVKTSNSTMSITAGMGKEWRKGSTRLQGYYGVDGLVTLTPFAMTKNVTEAKDSDEKVVSTTTNKAKAGFGFGIGARGFLGAEYFVLKQFAIGAEYSYSAGINYTGAESTLTTVELASGTNPDDVETNGGSSFGFNIGGVGVVSLNLSLYF